MLVELLMVVVVLREWSTHLVSRSLGALLCFRFACCGLLVHAVLLVYLFFISQAWGSWLMVADDFRESRENAGVDRDRGGGYFFRGAQSRKSKKDSLACRSCKTEIDKMTVSWERELLYPVAPFTAIFYVILVLVQDHKAFIATT
jgi:hypothetical protein